MDWGTAAQWAGVFAAIGIAIWAARAKRHDEALKELSGNVEGCGKKLAAHETRLAFLETDIKHLPTKDDFHKLQVGMTELSGQMGVIIERVGPIKAIAERLQDVMMSEAHK